MESIIVNRQKQAERNKKFEEKSEYVRGLEELLKWKKEEEEKVRKAEKFTLKLAEELNKANIKEFGYKILDEIVTTDNYVEDDENEKTTNKNDKKGMKNNSNKEFNEHLLSDIEEASFEQGLSTDALNAHSKFSTPKETIYHSVVVNDDEKKDDQQKDQLEEMTSYNSLTKQYTKHCTEECTKQDCTHTIRSSETYGQILKIISNYNAKLKDNSNGNTSTEEENEMNEDNEENEDQMNEYVNSFNDKNYVDFKDELKQIHSSSNHNIYELNEFMKEKFSKILDPNLTNEQYIYRSMSETNLNYSHDSSEADYQMKNESIKKKDFKLRNKTFSSDAINNQIKSIEKDLGVENIENEPIRPGIDGRNVRTFDDLLNQRLMNDYDDYGEFSSMFIKPENPTKRPYLRKGAGLKRFQQRSSSEPRGKLCKIRNQKLKQLKQQNEDKKIIKKYIDNNKKIPDLKRIDYLAQPKYTSSKDLRTDFDKENDLMRSNQLRADSVNRDYVISNLSDRSKNELIDKKSPKINKSKIPSIKITKSVDQEEIEDRKEIRDKKSKKNMIMDKEQMNKKARVQLVSKISVNKTYPDYQEKRSMSELVQSEWDNRESIEDSNKRLESLLEKFIELYEAKNNTKADENTRRHLINMLKNSLRIEDGYSRVITCKECGKNLEESDSEDSSFCCNPIEADITSSKFSDDPNGYLSTPRIDSQTVALRNKIENLQRRLINLQTQEEERIDQRIDENVDKTDCQSYTNQNENSRECTCNNQMEMLKEKLNYITNKLQSIEKNTMLQGSKLTSSMKTNVSNSPIENTKSKVINHQINVVEEPEKNQKMKIKKTNSHDRNKVSPIQTNKKQSVYRKAETEKRTYNQQVNPNDVVVHDVIEGGDRITSYKSGLKIIERSDGTIEKISSNGYQEINFPDSTMMRILVDGTKILDFPNGDREIRTQNYKRREFVDGNIKTWYSDGTRETRHLDGKLRIKDKYGNVLIDSRIPQQSTLH